MYNLPLIVALGLFCTGLVLVISKKNAIAILIGIEMIFNAAHLNMVYFSSADPKVQGQMFSLFSIIIAACETAIGLALVLQIYKTFSTNSLDDIDN